jgi:hypothetical protein
MKIALLPLAAAVLATQVHAMDIGVNLHAGGGSATANGQIASVMASRNIKQARMDNFPWDDANLIRDQITKINANGGRVQLIIHNSAEWDSSCNQNLPAVEQNSYNLAYNTVSSMRDIVHDFEIFNEVQYQAWINNEVPRNSAGTSAAPYAGKPCVASLTAAIRGASRAVHDLGQRVIINQTGRDWGWLYWLRQNGVTWDLTGLHIYPELNHPSVLSDPWYGTNGPLYQASLFGKPMTINEFNCGEVFFTGYENTPGQPYTEQCLRSVNKHIQEIRANTYGTVESVHFYEMLDEPAKAAPENRFGLLYQLGRPKPHLFLWTAFAGGELNARERRQVTSRGLMSDASGQRPRIPACTPSASRACRSSP